ncbi:hypothetical protein Pfo_001960 [Paulownia fortunei]|nr:hypothetical protein Pfo_001960 [Paulownia fortunei]
MPPKRIDEQPVIDRATSDISMEESTSDASTQRQHRDTRAAHGDKLRRYIKEMGRILVTFRKSDGHPTRQHASSFMIELGVAVKKFVPLQVADWRHITEE